MEAPNPRRFYYAVKMSDGDVLFFDAQDCEEAMQLANEDVQKQMKGARAVMAKRHEITAERRWS